MKPVLTKAEKKRLIRTLERVEAYWRKRLGVSRRAMNRARGVEGMQRRVYFDLHQYGQASLSRLVTSARDVRTLPQLERVYIRLGKLKDRVVERRKALRP